MNYLKTFEFHKYEDIVVKSFSVDEYRKVLFEDGD